MWDLYTHQQLYEFSCPGEQGSALAYRPPAPYARSGEHYELAVGFASGMVRVLDVATATVIQVRGRMGPAEGGGQHLQKTCGAWQAEVIGWHSYPG